MLFGFRQDFVEPIFGSGRLPLFRAPVQNFPTGPAKKILRLQLDAGLEVAIAVAIFLGVKLTRSKPAVKGRFVGQRKVLTLKIMKVLRRSRQRHLRHALVLGLICLFEGLVRILSLGILTTDLRDWYLETELKLQSAPPDSAAPLPVRA